MAGLLKEFCEVIIISPAAMAIIFALLFAAIGTVALAGVNGRRRLWEAKAEKEDVKEDFDEVKRMVARVENRVYDLAKGMGRQQEPLSPEVIEMANHKK